MSDNGRLIINARGETVQVLPAAMPSKTLAALLQFGMLADAIIELPSGLSCVALALSKDEVMALALKLADAIGMICELRPKHPERPARAPARG